MTTDKTSNDQKDTTRRDEMMKNSPAWNDTPDLDCASRVPSAGFLSLVVNNVAPKGSKAAKAAEAALAAHQAQKGSFVRPTTYQLLFGDNDF